MIARALMATYYEVETWPQTSMVDVLYSRLNNDHYWCTFSDAAGANDMLTMIRIMFWAILYSLHHGNQKQQMYNFCIKRRHPWGVIGG
jgi:hypothetical protein